MNRGCTLLWRQTWANPLLCEPGRKFSRRETWLYIVNVLAAGRDDEPAGLKRGEFRTSIRFLAKTFNWSPGTTERFIAQLNENSMISRVVRDSLRPKAQEPEHFIVCNYDTYNQALPEVKALTSERLRKCRSRMDQTIRDWCLERYLEDFTSAVQKAQQTPFLRGAGARGWLASFDWFVANYVIINQRIERIAVRLSS